MVTSFFLNHSYDASLSFLVINQKLYGLSHKQITVFFVIFLGIPDTPDSSPKPKLDKLTSMSKSRRRNRNSPDRKKRFSAGWDPTTKIHLYGFLDGPEASVKVSQPPNTKVESPPKETLVTAMEGIGGAKPKQRKYGHNRYRHNPEIGLNRLDLKSALEKPAAPSCGGGACVQNGSNKKSKCKNKHKCKRKSMGDQPEGRVKEQTKIEMKSSRQSDCYHVGNADI